MPRDDPGLAAFQAARKPVDLQMSCEAQAQLKAVESGMLQAAAKALLPRVGPVQMRPHEGMS